MNYRIKKLPWESDFFNKTIAEIFSVENHVNSINDSLNFDLIISKNNPENLKINGFKKSYSEEKITFCKKHLKQEIKPSKFKILNTDTHPIAPEKLFDLAYLSGHESRFNKDENFSSKEFKKLYNSWVINSINKTFGYKVFYINNNEELPIAFATLNKKNAIGQIGLVAVAKNYHGQGIGRLLLNFVESFCKSDQIHQLHIPTQKHNISAMRFYEKLGYTILQKTTIAHYWKNNYDSI